MLLRTLRIGRFVLLVAALSATIVRATDEWPEFRGPSGQGHADSKGLPTRWGDTDNVVWKQAVAGLGWSSPVVAQGRVFVTTAAPAGGESQDLSLRAIALDAATGKVAWDVEIFTQSAATAPKIHGKNSHASPTPIVHGKRVIVHFGHQGTACLDLDGKILWKNRELAYAPVHGNGGTPALMNGKVIFSCDGAADPFIAALDEATGAVVWKTPRVAEATKKFAFSTPLVIRVGEQTQVITPGANCVCALDPNDGHEIWRVRYDGYSVIPRPIFGHGLLFIGTGYDSPTVMAIRPEGTGDITESQVVWTIKKAAPHTPSLLLVDDLLYMVSDRGIATCVEAKTGTEVWQERLGGNYSASPIYNDGLIYFTGENGEGTVIRAGRTFDVVQKNTLSERTFASFAVAGKALFVRTEGHVYRFEQK